MERRIINIDTIENGKVEADKVSPTFCLAKWHHTTIYLQSGETHSCYHPPPHKIPLDNLASNPSSLHNTPEKKEQRRMMLNGEKPQGCQYCWNIEAMGKDFVSDRHERNTSIYTPERIDQIKKMPWDFDVSPQYIEVSFGHECNFKCGYCHPKASSAYYKEIEQFGPYRSVVNHYNSIDNLEIYRKEEENPYVKAWWDWWPEASKTLDVLRITGGEPLLQQSTWKLLDSLETNPLPNLELNINSNLGVKTVLVERLSEKIKHLRDNNKIKEFKLFTSIDTWGSKAEYIRTGLDINLWEQHLKTYLTTTDNPIYLMITFNILSVTSFKGLLEKILEWRNEFNVYKSKVGPWQRIGFDTPHLKEPLQYDINILPKEQFMPYMLESLSFMEANMDENDKKKFSRLEVEKFRRVVRYMETTHYSAEKVKEGRKDFYNWFKEYDRRRNTNFVLQFPELIEFRELCKQEA